MMNNVKTLREAKNLTQTELAEKSGLSLRTIQRIEAGSILKGFTLKAIAQSLETQPENLMGETEENTGIDRAKLINLSALFGLIFPYGNVILPLILTYKTKDAKNKELGKNIVSIQIVLSVIASLLMMVSPFLQKAFSLRFPLFLIFLIAIIGIKLIVILQNGINLNQKSDLYFKLKTNFL
ncbi:MAG: helix-turn-helix domain-containing protein [Flavobacterium lindanitolerans]|uniref:helix-turn-helix domain-containing protein n=1 Tax=Flavobacterium lindanitolerans TaxID=428988 RepID=UPI001A3D4DF3|nr:helix-turn-helix domain-containing protein [Flavobacterium lindanitolerans]MBL7868034.1 helix-turn-helix domain-containing protein [Flavobacterium lindanitolerans]